MKLQRGQKLVTDIQILWQPSILLDYSVCMRATQSLNAYA